VCPTNRLIVVARQWTQGEALKELDQLLSQSDQLRANPDDREGLVAWGFRVTDFLTEVFGQDSQYYMAWRQIPWRPTGQAFIGGPARPDEVWDHTLGLQRLQREAIQNGLTTARGTLSAARAKLEAAPEVADVYEAKDTQPEASLLIKTINLAEHKLRKVMRSAPSSEKALQEEFEKLLIGAGVEYSREAKSIEYSTKTYIPDFTVEKASLAIELKVCLDESREKKLPAEINDDILAYKQEYPNMLFVVYDTGHIRDVDRFAANFEEESGVVVRVVKH
jgi:hypothetical protein